MNELNKENDNLRKAQEQSDDAQVKEALSMNVEQEKPSASTQLLNR